LSNISGTKILSEGKPYARVSLRKNLQTLWWNNVEKPVLNLQLNKTLVKAVAKHDSKKWALNKWSG
jgi:hypothetical protein